MNFQSTEIPIGGLSSLPRHPVTAIDLFAGAGGFSLAAREVGIDVKLAVERNPKACETFRHNLIHGVAGAPKLVQDDITELNPTELQREHFPNDDNCDLLLGGPPCQGFSTHRINGAGIGDSRNALIHTYFEFVHAFQPKLFLMENVPGMLWPRHKSYLDEFYANGEREGYQVFEPAVLDARDYGVPQRRHRVFILGARKDIDITKVEWPPKPSHGCERSRATNPDLKPWVNSKSVFKKAPDRDENNRHMNHSEELVEVFKSTPKNGGSRRDSRRVLPCHQKHNGHKDVYGRIDPKQPGPTMTTACINPSKGRFVHPTQHHGITVRQAARFQTFPDSFVFKGGLIACGEQIGNAVPVKLGRALLVELSEAVKAIRSNQGLFSRQ